jgi:hypothetical protein
MTYINHKDKPLSDRQLAIASHYKNDPVWFAVGTTDHVNKVNTDCYKPKAKVSKGSLFSRLFNKLVRTD